MIGILRFCGAGGVLALGVGLGGASPASAQMGQVDAQGFPIGSYRQTCTVATVDQTKKTITAVCKRKNGKNALNRDWVFRYCTSGIENRDGVLWCLKDTAAMNAASDAAYAEQKAKKEAEEAKKAAEAAQAKKDAAAAEAKAKSDKALGEVSAAKPAFDAAAVIVLGRNATFQEVPGWVNMMRQPDYGMAAAVEAKEVKFIDAVKFLKLHIAKPAGAGLRAAAINNAILKVHGRESVPIEQANWDVKVKGGTAWFAPIVLAEQKAMYANAEVHKFAIIKAYRTAMGRTATQAELDYWHPRKMDYEQMVGAARAYLYSAAGTTDLIETIGRYYAATNNNRQPTSAEVKALMVKFTPIRAIYDEMVNPGGKAIKIGK